MTNEQQGDRERDNSHGDLLEIAANSISGLDEAARDLGDCFRATGKPEVIGPKAQSRLVPDGRLPRLTVVLVRAKEPEMIVGDSLSWSPDSRYIVFGKGRTTTHDRKTQLLAISPRGGDPHALGLARDFVREVSFHPDGHHVAFGVSAGKDKIEVWVMENFLPTFKAAQRR